MKQLTEKQKKIAWVIAGILIVIHFAPRFFNSIHAASAHAVVAKPSPYVYAPAPVPPPPPPHPSPEALAAAKYTGIWAGSALMPDTQDRCNIRLEIRVIDPAAEKLKGYESQSCLPMQPLAGGKLTHGTIADVIRATSPVSSVMTGAVQDDGLSFTIDQNIGTSTNGCGLSGFTITDFGQGQVMAQWQEGTCPAGKMILIKARG